MKKLFSIFLLAFFCFGSLGQGNVFAADTVVTKDKVIENGGTVNTTEKKDSTKIATEPTKIETTSSNPSSYSSGTCVINPLSGIIGNDLLGLKPGGNDACLQAGVEYTYTYRYLIPYFIKLALTLGSGIAVLMIVYYGMMFLVRGSEEEARGNAIKGIAFSLLGLFVMILSRAIVSIVQALPLG